MNADNQLTFCDGKAARAISSVPAGRSARARIFFRIFRFGLAAAAALFTPSSRAQWQTQSITLKPGWNAVFLHVNASHILLDDLIDSQPGNPISEVWQWQPTPSLAQFIQSPQQPIVGGSQWLSWDRSPVVTDALVRLIGNAAYLVRNTNSVPYTWNIIGQPVLPVYQWTSSAQNFFGFSTPASTPPRFVNFLAPAPDLQRLAEIFYYPGGESGPPNVQPLNTPFTSTVNRGQAYWIRADDYFNRYFGPFEVALQGKVVRFDDALGQYRLRLKNTTATAQTVQLNLLSSEAAPAGQTPIAATPTLLVRGPLNTTNLLYGYSVLNGATPSWTLAPMGQPGAEIEVVLGLNRAAITNAPGSLLAGLLRFTDAGGLSQVDVGVSAGVADSSGLWVGGANVSQVRHYLKSFARDAAGAPLLDPAPSGGGVPYLVTNVNTSIGATARSFPLRLIIHRGDSATALLQRVYYGLRLGTNTVTTRENLLDSTNLASASRISAAHLPFKLANDPWLKSSGDLGLGTNLVFTVTVDANDHASNPFIHSYHPDHDNLGADFRTVQPQGVESYGIRRVITLSFTSPPNDFASLTAGGKELRGVYAEEVTFNGRASETRSFNVQGSFVLNRISPVATLTTH